MSSLSRRPRTSPFLLLTLITAVLLTSATLLSPLLLEQLVPSGPPWQELSAVGETYGAASAVISAVALVAIGLSLFLQAREARFARRAAERAHHFDLMQLQIENPELSRALGMPTTGLSPQLHIYLNLVLSYWEMLFLVGEMPDSVLIEYAKGDFFGTQAGRQYWEGTREYRLTMAKNRASRRFIQVIDSAWQQLTPLEPPAPATNVSPPRANVQAAVVGAATTAAVALMIMWLTRSRKRPTNT